MLVSRKNLALIHFVAREAPSGLDVGHAAHQSIKGCAAAGLGSILGEPLAESGIQSFMLRSCHQSGLLD